MKTTILISLAILFNAQMTHAIGVDEGRYVGLQGGYSLLSSSLSGTGFNADLPSKGNLSYGAEASYQSIASDTAFSIKYDHVASQVTAPGGLTPSNVNAYREEIRLMARMTPWDRGSLKSMRLGVGYAFLKSGATDTTTYNLMTKQDNRGPVFSAQYTYKTDFDLSVTTELLLYFPHHYNEKPQSTGHNPRGMGTELSILADYWFTDRLTGFAGFVYRQDEISYDGTGSRGVTAGKDTRTLMTIPFGIKVGY